MTKSVWIVAAFLCMVCIVALLIAPLVDPPATRLLSDSSQLLMLCWVIAVGWVLFINLARLFPFLSLSRAIIPSHPSHTALHPLSMSSVMRR
jgi:hypothetical protein